MEIEAVKFSVYAPQNSVYKFPSDMNNIGGHDEGN